jgi:5-methylcytosine-specific restriction protein A
MPYRPISGCSFPRCPNSAAPGKDGKCEVHARLDQAMRNDAQRGGSAYSAASGGSRLWRRIRAMQLSREPLCRACAAKGLLRPAVTVDHIVPRSQGGGDDNPNLQSLCRSCHTAKSQAERRGEVWPSAPVHNRVTGGFA